MGRTRTGCSCCKYIAAGGSGLYSGSLISSKASMARFWFPPTDSSTDILQLQYGSAGTTRSVADAQYEVFVIRKHETQCSNPWIDDRISSRYLSNWWSYIRGCYLTGSI